MMVTAIAPRPELPRQGLAEQRDAGRMVRDVGYVQHQVAVGLAVGHAAGIGKIDGIAFGETDDSAIEMRRMVEPKRAASGIELNLSVEFVAELDLPAADDVGFAIAVA